MLLSCRASLDCRASLLSDSFESLDSSESSLSPWPPLGLAHLGAASARRRYCSRCSVVSMASGDGKSVLAGSVELEDPLEVPLRSCL